MTNNSIFYVSKFFSYHSFSSHESIFFIIYANIIYLCVLCILLNVLFVIFSNNTIKALLHLILVYIFSALILIILDLDFLALLIIIVYVGAIAVLFIFVIMLLNIKEVWEVQQGFSIFFFMFIFFSFQLFLILNFNTVFINLLPSYYVDITNIAETSYFYPIIHDCVEEYNSYPFYWFHHITYDFVNPLTYWLKFRIILLNLPQCLGMVLFMDDNWIYVFLLIGFFLTFVLIFAIFIAFESKDYLNNNLVIVKEYDNINFDFLNYTKNKYYF